MYSEDEARCVREFFELFKTPWEPYKPSRSYDVIVTTLTDVPETSAGVLLIFCSDVCPLDRELGLDPEGRLQAPLLACGEDRLPVYGAVATFRTDGPGMPCVAAGDRGAGFRVEVGDQCIFRLGYNLFREVEHLLNHGQPVQNAPVPSLDLHIAWLRKWILDGGFPLIEIAPSPWGCRFSVCLTHDIDFIGIRQHLFDHTMWGFVYRASLGATADFLGGRKSLRRLLACWWAVCKLPFVYLGIVRDFWLPFDWLLTVEKGLPATYFLIPFKGRPGERVSAPHPERRATAYDLGDIPDWIRRLRAEGCEVGIHGIDAWHSVELGRAELNRLAEESPGDKLGIRMHWLLYAALSAKVIEAAGYDYDATMGYNETPGYRSGTTQPYQPFDVQDLLELPLHIQDGALFYPKRMGLAEGEAWEVCQSMITHTEAHGGVLTVLWHDRSHGPERFWGEFYRRLVAALKQRAPWFCTAGQAVDWHRARRSVRFERQAKDDRGRKIRALPGQRTPSRPFRVLAYPAAKRCGQQGFRVQPREIKWSGEAPLDLSPWIPDDSEAAMVGRSAGLRRLS